MFNTFRFPKLSYYFSLGFMVLLHFSHAQKIPFQYVETRIGTAPATTDSAGKHSEAGSELKGQTIPAVGTPNGRLKPDPLKQSVSHLIIMQTRIFRVFAARTGLTAPVCRITARLR
jgi:hypothetical protein